MNEPQLLSAKIPKWSNTWLIQVMSGLLLAGLASLWIDSFVSANWTGEGIPGDFRRMVGLSEIFAHGFGGALAVILIWQLAPGLRHRLRPLAGCLLFSGLACQGIKLLVARRRPLSYESGLPSVIGDTWYGLMPNWQVGSEYAFQSFPSAHAATATALAIGLCWLIPRGKYFFVCMAILASSQRIFSGAHWLSDVIAGVAVAVTVCFIVFRIERGKEFKRLRKLRANRQSISQPGSSYPDNIDSSRTTTRKAA